MVVLQAEHLTKSYIATPIFKDVSFTINERDRVGLVGANGAGKTTLFECITGELSYDSGQIYQSAQVEIGYLAQHITSVYEGTLFTVVMAAFHDVLDKREELNHLEEAMSSTSGKALEDIYDLYARKTEAYERAGGYTLESRAKGIIRGLGFSEEDMNRPITSFSGGERARVELAKLLVREPALLVLDEPTNHLDIKAVLWLENHLKNYPGTIFMISHDRYFLDQVTNRIFELSNQRLKTYNGNYSNYQKRKTEDELVQHRHFIQQQKLIKKESAFIDRYRAGNKSKQARGREKRLARLSRIDDVVQEDRIHIRKQQLEQSSLKILSVRHLSKHFGSKTVLLDVSFEVERGDKIGIVGPNGAGKSTLLKVLTGDLPMDDGEVQYGAHINSAYYDQQLTLLDENATVLEQILYHTDLDLPQTISELARMMFYQEDWEKKIGDLSGGEKARMLLLLILLKNPNVILMDEPTNHLDIRSKSIMEDYLKNYEGTLIIVSHDRFFLDQISNKTFELEHGHLHIYPGNYTYYKYKKEELLLKNLQEAATPKTSSTPKVLKKNTHSKSKLKAEKAQLESEIEKLEDELTSAKGLLSGNASEDSVVDYQALADQIDRIDKMLSDYYEAWEICMNKMEELDHV